MKKITFMLFAILISIFSFSQNRKGEFRLSSANAPHELYVSFNPDLKFEPSHSYTEQAVALVPELGIFQQQYHFMLEKGIAISDIKIDEMEANANALSKDANSVKRLRNIFKVKIADSDNQKLLALAKTLETLTAVTYCSLISTEAVKPPADISPVTPNYASQQTYINANPGVNMQYAWNMGLSGTGIRVRDVEYGLNKNHEEFNTNAGAFISPGMTIANEASVDYTEHGTAVFGIVYADKGAYGISGMAYGAQEMVLFPEWQQIGYSRINAVSQSIASSVAGDVIIYEMQTTGQGGQYVPAEYENILWDLTKAATDAGIVIVAAAGNGDQNLDTAFYVPYMNRGNSGAIIVGAGTSDISHNKMSFSTYGSRVDVQAWGVNVLSCGYGNAVMIGSDFNQGYTFFSGTSSATPIVASCAIVLQSHYHTQTGNYLTSAQLRNILKTTGIAQGTGGNIGPLPNMQAAISAVNMLAVKDFGPSEFTVFPNPATDKITIMANSLSASAKIQILNSIGQTVYRGNVSEDSTVDVGNLPTGFYFVELSDGGRVSVKKIIKK